MGLLRRMKVARIIREESRPVPVPIPWIEYGCWKDGEVITVYPSQAAMENDPIYGRSEGARSVARGRAGKFATKWRPIFSGDLATHRYQAGSED